MRNKMMALLLILSMACCLLAGCGKGSDANGDGSENIGVFTAKPENGVIDLHQMGLSVKIPDSMLDMQDKIGAKIYVEPTFGWLDLYMIDKNDPDNMDFAFAQVYSEREAVDIDSLINPEEGITADMVRELGDNKTFYYAGYRFDKLYEVMPNIIEDQIMKNMDSEQKETYLALMTHCSDFLDGITIESLTLPEPPKAADIDHKGFLGMTLEDLDRNQVNVKDLISQNKLTMVNYWGTFCGACINEMPELEKLEETYKDQGFEIVGITYDIYDLSGNFSEDALLDARDIISGAGVKYPVLIASKELVDLTQISQFPSTYFYDADGNPVGEPILGSNSYEGWEKILKERLQQVQ